MMNQGGHADGPLSGKQIRVNYGITSRNGGCNASVGWQRVPTMYHQFNHVRTVQLDDEMHKHAGKPLSLLIILC